MNITGASRKTASQQAIALAVVALFCFQLGRVYLVSQVDAFYTCPRTQIWTSSQPPGSAIQAAGASSVEISIAPSDEDGRTSVRGCKDTFDGLGLTPVQPLGAPSATSVQKPAASWTRLLKTADFGLQHNVSPLIQPPRSLS